MADEKKPKIDLKARLGKKTVAAPGGTPGAVPPPVGIPKPIGIPKPVMPGLGSAPERSAPKLDASDPYAAIEADQAPAKAEPQAIKIEMSEEVVAAQKKGRAKVVILAAAAAVVGGVLGYTIGTGSQKATVADVALEGAKSLVTEVDTANAEVEELSEVLKAAGLKLSDNKFPADEVSKLGAIRIGFDGSNLVGKGMGRFNAKTAGLLLKYASAVQAANDQKESLASILSLSKKGIEDYLEQQSKPKVRWSVFVSRHGNGPWAVMQPLPKPFLIEEKEKEVDGKKVKYAWPKEFEIVDGGKKHKLKRYTGGDATRDNKIIPVDPSTHGAVCPSSVLVSLKRELRTMQEVLRGKKGDPGKEDQPGLVQLGADVLEALKEIGQPS